MQEEEVELLEEGRERVYVMMLMKVCGSCPDWLEGVCGTRLGICMLCCLFVGMGERP